ncbi:MAG: hypothetical protein LBG18_02140 [Mediterranea sp.]|nr:hypothetical protein [Mediterranea sp.]
MGRGSSYLWDDPYHTYGAGGHHTYGKTHSSYWDGSLDREIKRTVTGESKKPLPSPFNAGQQGV